MGRAKTELRCLSTEKSRKYRFKSRSKGLESKMKSFFDKCGDGVEACLIAYEENGNAPPMIWPKDPVKVRSIVEKYELQKNVRPPKTFDLKDFFEYRTSMVNAEISKMRKDILSIKYPTSDSHFKNLDMEQLRMFIAILDAKIGDCTQRIDMLKNNQQTESNSNFGQSMAHSDDAAFVSNPNQMNFMKNMSQVQLIPTPTMSLNHDTGLHSQMLHPGPQMPLLDPNLMQLMGSNNGMVDSANQVEGSLDCIIQNGAFVNATNQLSEPMIHFDPNLMQMMAKKNAVMDSTNQIEVPLGCTEQNAASVNSTSRLGEPLDWASLYANAEAWASDFGDSENWIMNQPCELVDRTSQPSMPANWTSELHEPDLHVIPSQSQNAPKTLHTLPPTWDGVLTHDY